MASVSLQRSALGIPSGKVARSRQAIAQEWNHEHGSYDDRYDAHVVQQGMVVNIGTDDGTDIKSGHPCHVRPPVMESREKAEKRAPLDRHSEQINLGITGNTELKVQSGSPFRGGHPAVASPQNMLMLENGTPQPEVVQGLPSTGVTRTTMNEGVADETKASMSDKDLVVWSSTIAVCIGFFCCCLYCLIPGEAIATQCSSSSSKEDLLPAQPMLGKEVGRPQNVKSMVKRAVTEICDLSILASIDEDPVPDITNPHVWWRHPVVRLITVTSILFLDFYIYGEDPVQDSSVGYPYYGVFEDLFIIEEKWPENPSHKVARITLFVIVTIFSIWFGRQIMHHKILRDWLGMSMFSENNGALLVEFVSFVVFFEYVLPYPVNLIESGTTTAPITENSIMTYAQWGKIWQSLAATADMVSFVMITDAVLQDRTVWPHWGSSVKRVWNDYHSGWVRVIVVWFVFLVVLPLSIWGLWGTNRTNGIYTAEVEATGGRSTTQWMRVAIAALILFLDISTCLQDWEFPTFNTPLDFKVPGLFQRELNFPFFTQLLQPISNFVPISKNSWDVFTFQMTGKWVAFFPAFACLGVDLWYMCKTIFTYYPSKVGEYEHPTNCSIYVIHDETLLKQVYRHGYLDKTKADLISWKARKDYNDELIHSRFCDNPAFLKYIPLVFGLCAAVTFIILIYRAQFYWGNFTQRNSDEEKLMAKVKCYIDEAHAAKQV